METRVVSGKAVFLHRGEQEALQDSVWSGSTDSCSYCFLFYYLRQRGFQSATFFFFLLNHQFPRI